MARPAFARHLAAKSPPAIPLALVLGLGRRRASLFLLGPAFVASVAYVDPGNFASNFEGGARFGYQLAWVIVMANVMAMLIQYSTAKVGLATSESLPSACRTRYGKRTNFALWVQGEIVAMATDLAEFVGAAVGLNLLFGIPLLPAAVITAVVSFALLGLQQRGFKRFEAAIIGLLALVLGGFLFQLLTVGGQSAAGLISGLVPRVEGQAQATLVVAILGATVMPHVIYLHSALMPRRVEVSTPQEMRTLLRYTRWDCVLGLGVAGLVNLSMLCVAAALFAAGGLAGGSGLVAIHDELATAVGGLAALAFAIALTASGFASASVGTYAGQVIMGGFMGWQISLLIRRAVTMLPSIVLLASSVDATDALVYSQVILSFGIPFALVPLTLISADRHVMGDLVNRRRTSIAMWLITICISSLNIYLILQFLAIGD